MAKPATIANLDGAIRLCRGRTLRSTCYGRGLDRLPARSQRQIKIMEALLFSQRRNVQECRSEDLLYPEAQFANEYGFLCYFFSEQEQKFILTHFELYTHDGGLSQDGRLTQHGFEHTYYSSHGWVSDIAARIAAILARWQRSAFEVSSMSNAWKNSKNPCRFEIAGMAPAPYQSPNRSWGCYEFGDHGVFPRAKSVLVGLPSWSVLNRYVAAPQQLENPYARAILAGEALSRLGWEISTIDCYGRFSRGNPVYRWDNHSLQANSWGRALLEESQAILGAVAGRFGTELLRERTRHFVTTVLIDKDVMNDDRRLALIHSEMTLRLSLAVSMQAGAIAAIGSCSIDLHQGLLRKYALLSEFVTASGRYFGISLSVADNSIVDQVVEYVGRDRWKLFDLLTGLWEFRNSTSMIAGHSAGLEESASDEEWVETHDRLMGIAAEILEVKDWAV